MNEDELLEKLMNGDEDTLKELKLWLFRENIRLKAERLELDQYREELTQAQLDAAEDRRQYLNHLAMERAQIRREENLIAEKLEAIKRGFEELDMDRRALNRREEDIRTKEIQLDTKLKYSYTPEHSEVEDVLFSGVNNIIALKKRYKDLMKIYHPDCIGGDERMVHAITRSYEKLLSRYSVSHGDVSL